MKFKIDENLPVEIAKLLTDEGYNAETVSDQGLGGTEDSILVEVCRKEGRVLVTLDTDFSNIRAYPPEELPGIVVLGIKSQAKRHVVEMFKNIIPLFAEEPLCQRLWIVEETRVRVRGGE